MNFNTELLEVLCHDKICFKQRLNPRVLKEVGSGVCRDIANLFRDSNVHALVWQRLTNGEMLGAKMQYERKGKIM